MNSKECLELAILEYEKETIDDENNQWVKNVLKGLKQIKQDLEQLKELRKNHAKLLVQIAHLEEENEKLEKENQRLKKVRDNYSDQLNYVWNIVNSLKDENTKPKQAIKILKDKIEFEDLGEMQGGNVYRGYFNDCLDEEQYELLNQVFESVGEEQCLK